MAVQWRTGQRPNTETRRDRSLERARQSIEERPHRIRRAVGVEIDMPAGRKAHHLLWFVGKREQSFAEPDGSNAVLLAVQDEQRRLDPSDALIRPEGILDEPANGCEGISGRPDVGRGGERRVENKSADLAFGCKCDGDAGAERLAPENDPSGRNARGGEIVGGPRIQKEPGLGRLAG